MRQATGTVTCTCSLAITRNRRSALKTPRFHVPARIAQDRVPCRRQAREVRHLAARDNPHAAIGRQAQQVAHPAGSDLVRDRQRRRRLVDARVLVPRRRQPVGRDRHRQRTPDHEPEVARTGGSHQPRLDVARQVLDHRSRILTFVAQRPGEPGDELGEGR